MTRHYQQLTYDQRCQIYALKKTCFSQRLIAQEVGVNQSTVSRELSRNAGRRGYRYQQAHRLSRERRALTHQKTKMTPALLRIIEGRLRLQWSPEQISGWLRGTDCNGVSHESIYLHIWRDKRAGGDLYRQLRRQGKKYDKRRNGVSTRGHIKNRQGIEKRPSIVDQRVRLGDWEIDTVIGKKHQGAIVTIVERSTQKLLCRAIPNKTAKAVTQATIELLRPYKKYVHTITADNGKEFSGHEAMTKSLDAQVYFANPYSSWERGLNENTNGLLRQYFPKWLSLKQVDPNKVTTAMKRLNARPRKTLGFKTPNQRWSEMAT